MTERGRLHELRSAVSGLQAKVRNQEGLLNDLDDRLMARDTGAHERLRVVEASMATLRCRIDALESNFEEAKNFPVPKAKAQDLSEGKPLGCWARELRSGKQKLGEQLEKRLVALEAVNEDSLKRLRSDLNRAFSLAQANSGRIEVLEAKEPTEARLFSCVEGAAQVATRAFSSLDSSVKSMELQVSSITESMSACGEEQQRQAAELEQLSRQVAHSRVSQEQLEDMRRYQLKMLDDIEALKEDFVREAESVAEQKEAVMQGFEDGKAELAHLEKNMASLRAELGERHSMLEERLLRSQSRVAQEIGEQRAHTESRLQHLEDEASRAFMSNDHDALERVRLKEVDDALWKSVEHVEHRLHGVLKCLQTLYRKVGLSTREVPGFDTLVSTESEDVWVGPGFCQLRSPRIATGQLR